MQKGGCRRPSALGQRQPAGSRCVLRRFQPRRVQVLFEERLQRGSCGILVRAFHRDGDGVAALDAHAHQGHQLQRIDRSVALGDGDGALILFALLDQQTGGAGVDADRFLDGILKLFHR